MGIVKAMPLPREGLATGAQPYSVHAAAAAVGVFPGTIYKWLRTDRLRGEQRKQGRNWVIYLTIEEVAALRGDVDCVRRSKKEAP